MEDEYTQEAIDQIAAGLRERGQLVSEPERRGAHVVLMVRLDDGSIRGKVGQVQLKLAGAQHAPPSPTVKVGAADVIGLRERVRKLERVADDVRDVLTYRDRYEGTDADLDLAISLLDGSLDDLDA